MKGEKIAVFVFLFSTILAILVGIFNVNVVSLSPLGTVYATVMIVNERGELVYLANKNLMNNPDDPEWGPNIPQVIRGKNSLAHHEYMGSEINLNLNYLNLPLASNSQDDFHFLFTTDKEGDVHSILKRVPYHGVTGRVTGAAVDNGEGDDGLSILDFPSDLWRFSLPIQVNDSNNTNSSSNSINLTGCDFDWEVLYTTKPTYVVDWSWWNPPIPPLQLTEEEVTKKLIKLCLSQIPSKYRTRPVDEWGQLIDKPPRYKPTITYGLLKMDNSKLELAYWDKSPTGEGSAVGFVWKLF